MEKEKILQLIALHLEGNVRELNKSLEDYKNASNLDEGDTIDPEDYSQQAEQKEMSYQMQIQLDNAQSGLSRLKDFSGKTFSVAKAGALIETDKNWILLGVSIPSLQVGNKELLGISPESPAFAVINGKAKGESFNLGKNSFTILEVN